MNDLWNNLKGKKTYIAAGAAAFLALVNWRAGDTGRAWELLALAAGFAGLRHALPAGVVPPAPPPAAPPHAGA